MKFPKKFIKKGKFKLHSGDFTDIFYDVNLMLTDYDEFLKIILSVPNCASYVGIATGGAVIASQFLNWAMIKDGELKGLVGDYCLIDDVCTTENSLKEAIKIIGKQPKNIFVVVDRRTKKTLKLIAMYTC